MHSLNDTNPVPVAYQRTRSLMIPPGIPDFMTRKRLLMPGISLLTGRAWTGKGKIIRVEVSFDDGHTFSEASVGQHLDDHAWCDWYYRWNALEGQYMISVRATDDSGYTQPRVAEWNAYGYGNNSWHKVEVEVRNYALAKF